MFMLSSLSHQNEADTETSHHIHSLYNAIIGFMLWLHINCVSFFNCYIYDDSFE